MDEDEFDTFYAASAQRITAQVYAMIGDPDEAQECVQEAFTRAWSQRRRFAEVQYREAWIRTTAYRLAVSRWRRLARGRRDPDRSLERGVVAAPSETYVAVVAALKKLPAAQRQAIVLHHLADMSVQQVAAELGIPAGTVKTRLRRGRAALAVLLADDLRDEMPEVLPRG